MKAGAEVDAKWAARMHDALIDRAGAQRRYEMRGNNAYSFFAGCDACGKSVRGGGFCPKCLERLAAIVYPPQALSALGDKT